MSFYMSSPQVNQYGIIPKIIFIVPYRDREEHLKTFVKTMDDVMFDYPRDDYQIWILHQCDTRSFNRGALKNLGFWICRNRYPYSYHNITLVFNDVDSVIAQRNLLNFETQHGVVKHFYGFKNALGGIFSMVAGDFESINGFPNFWGWGYEDNAIKHRVIRAKLEQDYTQFIPWKQTQYANYKEGDKGESRELLQNNDCDFIRQINRSEFQRYLSGTNEGISNLNKVEYHVAKYDGNHNNVYWMNVTSFSTGIEEDLSQRKDYDIRNGQNPFQMKLPSKYKSMRLGVM